MNLKSQSEVSKSIGISRQAINSIKKSGTYDFFVGNKVDIDSESWKSYLHERETRMGFEKIEVKNVSSRLKNIAENKNRNKKSIESKHKITKEERIEIEKRQENALTGGYDPLDFRPKNLADVERLSKIQNNNLQMRIRLNELIERDMVEIVIDSMSQKIQSTIVDLPRRVSGLICKKLDRVGMHNEIEKILEPACRKIIAEAKSFSLNSMEIKMLADEKFHQEKNDEL